MQDFELGSEKVNRGNTDAEDKASADNQASANGGELTMTVSPICVVEGQKKAFVNFNDGKRNAEGEIPACIISKASGFTDEEKTQLEDYMRANLGMLKKMAANIDVLAAMIKDE